MSDGDRQAEFQRIVARLIELGAVRVVLFGSRARGDFRSDSDFDVIVVLPGDETAPYATRLAAVYEAVVPRIAIDLVVYTPREFERLARERPFVRRAVREGRLLHAA
jgi:predicted nucleotidyltransferase